MSNYGYDIYNETSEFYVDNCAPAHENGNDITLEDRKTYYYPKIDLCNEGCEYNSIDYDNERINCECDITYKSTNVTQEKNEEDDQTYGEYLLSLINYKIIKCYNLFNDSENYSYNIGFYIGVGTLFATIASIGIFCIKDINAIKKDLLKDSPTKEKLEEINNQNKKRKSLVELNISKIQNNIESNPPKKYSYYINNVNTIENNDTKKNQESLKPNEKNKENKNLKISQMSHKANNRNQKSKNFSRTQRIKGQYNNNLFDNKHIIKEINNQQGKALKEAIKPNQKNKNTNDKYRRSVRNKTISLMDNPREINNMMATEEENINPNNNKVEDISELIIDFNYSHLIDIKDEDVKQSDLNDVPYLQALRLDKRDSCKVALTVFLDKVDLLNLFCNRKPYSYLSLTINV